jgi:hypothetical protein
MGTTTDSNFVQVKIRTRVLDSLDIIPKNSKAKSLLCQEKKIEVCQIVKRWACDSG